MNNGTVKWFGLGESDEQFTDDRRWRTSHEMGTLVVAQKFELPLDEGLENPIFNRLIVEFAKDGLVLPDMEMSHA
jgi:hypothetical protein